MPQHAGPATLAVCVNRRNPGHPSCAGRGSEAIAEALEAAAAPHGLEVIRLMCFGRCEEGPNVRILGGRFFRGCTLEEVPAVVEEALKEAPASPP